MISPLGLCDITLELSDITLELSDITGGVTLELSVTTLGSMRYGYHLELSDITLE